MKFIKQPVKGMRDFLPQSMEYRNYVINLIVDTYKKFGFVSIETPCIEHIENLTSNQGGENEKLIFKILKRGEKLQKDSENLCDSALRYDLTLPLARYYANNMNQLSMPFKAMQMGNVWRADRPQKGRFRQFMQCDIDILGDKTNLAEINLLIASSTVLNKLQIDNYTILINDRHILKNMAIASGFKEEECSKVFISLDKMDKIGIDGVKEELINNGYDLNVVNKYLELFKDNLTLDSLSYVDIEVIDNLKFIIDSISSSVNCKIKFDPTLVRGMSYYTSVIFEIKIDGYNSSIAGGGRYDNMIGKYANVHVPACGISIGFERLIQILIERKYDISSNFKKIAYLLPKGCCSKKLRETLKKAEELREKNYIVSVLYKNNNYYHQKDFLEKDGYEVIVIDC